MLALFSLPSKKKKGTKANRFGRKTRVSPTTSMSLFDTPTTARVLFFRFWIHPERPPSFRRSDVLTPPTCHFTKAFSMPASNLLSANDSFRPNGPETSRNILFFPVHTARRGLPSARSSNSPRRRLTVVSNGRSSATDGSWIILLAKRSPIWNTCPVNSPSTSPNGSMSFGAREMSRSRGRVDAMLQKPLQNCWMRTNGWECFFPPFRFCSFFPLDRRTKIHSAVEWANDWLGLFQKTKKKGASHLCGRRMGHFQPSRWINGEVLQLSLSLLSPSLSSSTSLSLPPEVLEKFCFSALTSRLTHSLIWRKKKNRFDDDDDNLLTSNCYAMHIISHIFQTNHSPRPIDLKPTSKNPWATPTTTTTTTTRKKMSSHSH